MRQIFDIGYHKTGTTWFQQNFYPNVSNAHFVDRHDLQAELLKDSERHSYNEDTIYCDEELTGNIHTGGNAGAMAFKVAHKISAYENPQVILFIRNQYDIIASTYLQYVKKGGNYSLDRYLYHKEFKNAHREPLFSFEHFNYYKIIDLYVSLLGKENVKIYLYEEMVEKGVEFMERFAEENQFNIDVSSLDFSRKNRSYPKGNVWLAKLFNTFTRKDVLYKYYIVHIPYMYEFSNYLLRRIRIGGKISLKKLLGKSNSQFISQEYKESNTLLKEQFGLPLDKYNYPL